MSLAADSQGVVVGKFTIPAGIPSGNKSVEFIGAAGSNGRGQFSGQGTIERQTWQQQTSIVETRWNSPPPPSPVETITGTQALQLGLKKDPIAQTFSMNSNIQISGVDLWFTVKPTSQAKVQIRETTAGFPNQSIVCESIIAPASINIGGAATRIAFPFPELLLGGVEYAIVVLCDDADGQVSVAELGKFDSVNQRWITSQAYNVGVLLTSSNASTWTAHQDRDLTFRILEASYTATSRTVPLGKVTVTGATDLLLMAYADRPSSATGADFLLTFPDVSTLAVADGQPVQLAAPITGDVRIDARLTGDANFSPVLYPDTQLVSGIVSSTADYVTRAIPAGASVAVKVIYEAYVPSGATVKAYYKGIDAGDTWAEITSPVTRPVDNGFVEFFHTATGVNETAVQVKLVLAGTTAARPRVRDLRVIVM